MRKVPDDERLSVIFSVRLSRKLDEELRAAAKAEDADAADLVRDALEAYLKRKTSAIRNDADLPS